MAEEPEAAPSRVPGARSANRFRCGPRADAAEASASAAAPRRHIATRSACAWPLRRSSRQTDTEAARAKERRRTAPGCVPRPWRAGTTRPGERLKATPRRRPLPTGRGRARAASSPGSSTASPRRSTVQPRARRSASVVLSSQLSASARGRWSGSACRSTERQRDTPAFRSAGRAGRDSTDAAKSGADRPSQDRPPAGAATQTPQEPSPPRYRPVPAP